jgi:HEAT repeat protein
MKSSFAMISLSGSLILCAPSALSQNQNPGEAFRAALRNPDAKVRIKAAEKLDRCDLKSDPQLVDAVLQALKDTDCDVRRLAADALSQTARTQGAPSVVAALVELIRSDRENKVRIRGLNSLACFRSDAKSAIPSLVKLSNDDDKEIRAAIITVLGQIDVTDKTVVELFINGLKDKDSEVRVSSLGRLNQVVIEEKSHRKLVIPALINALDDENANARCCSILALQNAGRDAAGALKTLELMSRKDTDQRVRDRAIRAIKAIKESRGKE